MEASEVDAGISAAILDTKHAASKPAAANESPDEHALASRAMPSLVDPPEGIVPTGDRREHLLLPAERTDCVAPPRVELMGAPPPRAAARPQAPPPQFHQPAVQPQAAGGLPVSWLN